jgi:hypothetical protein
LDMLTLLKAKPKAKIRYHLSPYNLSKRAYPLFSRG